MTEAMDVTEACGGLRGVVGDDGQEWQVWDTRPAIASPNIDPLSPTPESWETGDETSPRAMLAAADRIAATE